MLGTEPDLEQQIISLAMKTVLVASVALIVLILLASATRKQSPKFKLPLFVLIAITMLGSTAILIGGTVYLNVKSDSGGPVHWHADIEFWSCGAELDLRNPTGFLSNKIGSATYHEHNDKRIHLEGVVVDEKIDASLGKFMQLTGGYITASSIAIPLGSDKSDWFANEKQIDGDQQSPNNFGAATGNHDWITNDDKGALLTLKNGNYCSGGDITPSELQVFVFKYDKPTKTYAQTKLSNPADYVIRDESTVPPGDCIIIEYDVPKVRTDKLCQQYGVRDQKRCTEFGVSSYNPDLCNIREISNSTEPSRSTATSFPVEIDARCGDYLKNRGNPLYRPGLTEDEVRDCESRISTLEKQCDEESNNPHQGISASCSKLQEAQ